jgi:hypothetical protein
MTGKCAEALADDFFQPCVKQADGEAAGAH